MDKLDNQNSLFSAVAKLITETRQIAYRSSNAILIHTYWQKGQVIVEDEQGGKHKAEDGKAVLKNLSVQLTLEFGKGFDESNLRNIRQFYLAFPIRDALRPELSWTHYRIISRIENEAFRAQYMLHSIESNWDTRTLQRNIKTQYFSRVLEFPNEKLFASKYRLYLPKEEELKQLIMQDRINFELDHEN